MVHKSTFWPAPKAPAPFPRVQRDADGERTNWLGTDRHSRTAVARLLPPESVAAEVVTREIGVSVHTLERRRSEAMAKLARERTWAAAARLEAVIATATAG
jgi:hypothetical protein